jgi:hypothetical protein
MTFTPAIAHEFSAKIPTVPAVLSQNEARYDL